MSIKYTEINHLIRATKLTLLNIMHTKKTWGGINKLILENEKRQQQIIYL